MPANSRYKVRILIHSMYFYFKTLFTIFTIHNKVRILIYSIYIVYTYIYIQYWCIYTVYIYIYKYTFDIY